jgi:DNA-binding NarL/FixJ family response regulator
VDEEGTRLAVLLDEQPLWLDAMVELLGTVGIEVPGRTTRPTRALELVREHRPDVFIASARASDDEFQALMCVRRVADEHPEVKRVVLGQSSDLKDIDAAFGAGANVYCLKTSHPADLASAIRQTFATSIYLLETHRARAATSEKAKGSKRASKVRSRPVPVLKEGQPSTPELTARELEVLRLMSEGYGNSQMARMLWLSEQTVKFHLTNIYRKLEVSNRTEAARWAQLHDLLLPPPTAPERVSNRLGV